MLLSGLADSSRAFVGFGRHVWLGLCGPDGTGKTEHAHLLRCGASGYLFMHCVLSADQCTDIFRLY